MYKTTITYTDYNGEKHTDDFYFNMSKAELMELELIHPEGFKGWIERIIKADDRETILKTFKEIVLNSYGEKDETGRRFIKSKELSEAFLQTDAYSELFMRLITDADYASEFVNGITPKVENSDTPVEIQK